MSDNTSSNSSGLPEKLPREKTTPAPSLWNERRQKTDLEKAELARLAQQQSSEIADKRRQEKEAERVRRRSEAALAGLPPKKRLYALNLANGMTKREAALRAGYSEAMAVNCANRIESPDFKEAFARLMRVKIPASAITKNIQAGMKATDTQFFSDHGVVTDSRDTINWSERRKFTVLAAEMSGRYTPRQDLAVTKAVDPETLRKFSDIAERLDLTSLEREKLSALSDSHVPMTIESDSSK